MNIDLNSIGNAIVWAYHNWDTVVKIISEVIAGASLLAATVPSKQTSSIVNWLHKYVDTDKMHAVIDFLALNIFHAKDNSKAAAVKQTNVTGT